MTDTIYLDNASSITISGSLPWPDGKAFEIIDNLYLAGNPNPILVFAPWAQGNVIVLNIPGAVITLKWGDNQFNVT